MLEIIINQLNFSHNRKAVGTDSVTVSIARVSFFRFRIRPTFIQLTVKNANK